MYFANEKTQPRYNEYNHKAMIRSSISLLTILLKTIKEVSHHHRKIKRELTFYYVT